MSNDSEADGPAGKHANARSLAEQALSAQKAGDDDVADRLFAEAERADPDAVVAVLQDHANDAPRMVGTEEQDDDEVAAMSRTMQPGADAPSRAGVSGRGSGGDSQGT